MTEFQEMISNLGRIIGILKDSYAAEFGADPKNITINISKDNEINISETGTENSFTDWLEMEI